MIKVILLLLFFFNFSLKAEDLILSVDGTQTAKITLEELQKQGSTHTNYFNSATKNIEKYEGIQFHYLIAKIPKEINKKIVEVEVVALDGYKSYFSIDVFEKANAILAYKRTDGANFEHTKLLTNVKFPLGPYYLIWDFEHSDKSKIDRKLYGDVYQVNQINFITSRMDFGIKDSSDPELYLGYRTYKAYCINCHAIGEWGGNFSMDLTKGGTLIHKGKEYIVKYTLNPASINPQTKMLPLPKYKNSDDMAGGIYKFLTFAQNPDVYLKKVKKEADLNELKKILNEVHKARN